MNKVINKFLLTGDKFMSELQLKQPGFTYSAYGQFAKQFEISQRIQKFRETGNLEYLYRNKLDKVCFDQDVAYSDNKDLAKRTISDIFFKDRVYEIAKNPKYDGRLLSKHFFYSQ